MIDTDLIKQKIALMQRDLSELAKHQHLTMDEVAKDYSTHKLLERMIEVIINEAIDINQHLIVHSGSGELPFSFRESFLRIADLHVIPKDFSQEIADSVGLRNILVHQYRKLDEQIFYKAISQCLTQYKQYCAHILSHLEKIHASSDR